MGIPTAFDTRLAPAPPDIGAWLRRAARRALGRWSRWRAERREAAELAALDDIVLHDIGLSRHDIPHAARYGRPERTPDPRGRRPVVGFTSAHSQEPGTLRDRS
jgi:uncharacterized protein YjiS (DUF1127 family)